MRGRLLAGLVLLLAGLALIVTGAFEVRWLLLAGLVPLPVAGWLLARGLDSSGRPGAGAASHGEE